MRYDLANSPSYLRFDATVAGKEETDLINRCRKTVDAAPFFDAINAAPAGDSAATALPPPPVSLSISDMLPVSTPEMSPGAVTARPVNLPGMPPVFVLGDDPSSRRWLQQNAADLMRMQEPLH
ncbi:hypothetical protein E05_35670 [Plautia stali symbiont]|nr:hypothetical protein E05_35670 [Plautia stali symbiont]